MATGTKPRVRLKKATLRTRLRLHKAYHRAILRAERAGHKATAFLQPAVMKVWRKLRAAY